MTTNEFIAKQINKIWIERLEKWIKILDADEIEPWIACETVSKEMVKCLEEFKL